MVLPASQVPAATVRRAARIPGGGDDGDDDNDDDDDGTEKMQTTYMLHLRHLQHPHRYIPVVAVVVMINNNSVNKQKS